ncbi:rRNA biogenesis protein rrp36 [Lunasporangiospora selenospora]|uniref:rRNA biogenesis protein RRP36 n=1 Tax=Lunasporangiospora selenospora TaxID=979761 RepID=A0A9P6FYW8_9FUNG|nr:rRNA biogenesis protein rrp36 [Lunasporangiospora selenospora]
MAIKKKVETEDDSERALRRMQAFNQSDSEMEGNDISGDEESDNSELEEDDQEGFDDEEEVGEDDSEDEEEEEQDDEENDSDDDSDSDSDSDSESDSDDSVDSDDHGKQLKKLQKNLAQIPFDKLADIQQKVGMKAFRQSIRGPDQKPAPKKGRAARAPVSDDESDEDDEDDSSDDDNQSSGKGKLDKLRQAIGKDKKDKKSIQRREDKNRPMEIGSKKPVGRFRQVVEVASAKRRDPRFDTMSGKLDQDLFEKSYGFLNDYRADEMNKLKELIKKEKDEDLKEKLKGQLSKMVDRDATEATRKRRLEIKREHKRKERELVTKGKNPFFLKKTDQKKLELIEKFKELKDNPKALAKAMEKRRKRNSAKEKTKFLGGKRRRID